MSAGLLRFCKPEYLPEAESVEYFFDSQTGKIQESTISKDYIKLEDKVVLDYNINNSLSLRSAINTIKNCWKRIATRPANFEKFDMVRNPYFKIDGIIIAKDDLNELDNEFLVYYPLLGIREWEHASNLEFVYRPVKYAKSA